MAATDIDAAILPYRDDFLHYAPRALKIKEKSGQIRPFSLNAAQVYIHHRVETQLKATGKVRANLLKGRQQGASTYVQGRFYWKTSLRPGTLALVLTHLGDTTTALFGMTKRYHDLAPDFLRPHTSGNNANELEFDQLHSGYVVATAGNRKGVGRGRTFQLFHGCLSPETPVLDAAGALRPMREFAVGDLVRTRTGALAPISFISSQTKPVRDVVLKGVSLPLRATDEHRFWTRDGWKQLGDFQPGEVIGFPVAAIDDAAIAWPFRLPNAVRPQGGGSAEVGPDLVTPSYDVGRVLGLYLAEGCIIKQSNGGAVSAVCFAVHEREVARTVEWLRPLSNLYRSVRVSPRPSSKTVTVTVYGKSFANFVRERCGELDGKQLPQDWRTGGHEFARGLVHGYLAGDGHSSARAGDRRISASSIRSAITTGMRDVLASLGYGWACISFRDGALRNGRNERAQWTLRLCGPGVDRLCAEIGWSMPPRRRAGNGGIVVADGFAWAPVKSISGAAQASVMDFEVDHPDHSYCILHGATHNSEVAFWDKAHEHMAGLGQTVPDVDGSEMIKESTANGVGNVFHQDWQAAARGETDYINIFVPWFWQTEYQRPVYPGFSLDAEELDYLQRYEGKGLRIEHMVWRRAKLATDLRGDVALFNQEYPAEPALAFAKVSGSPLITAELVSRAQLVGSRLPPSGPKIMGVDPAEYGDDATAIVVRHGRRVLTLRQDHKDVAAVRLYKYGPMEVVAHVAGMADKIKPDAINVDCTGVGSGVADRLIELNYPVNRIHFGGKPARPELYVIKRDEIWGDMKEWFEDAPNEVPVDDALAGDLCAPQYTYDSSRRLRLESKEQMRSRGVKSPDSGDALALTFATPFASYPGSQNDASSYHAARSMRRAR